MSSIDMEPFYDDIIETHCLKNGIPCERQRSVPASAENFLSQDRQNKHLRQKRNSSMFHVDCEFRPRPPVLCARMSAQRIVLRTEGHEAVMSAATSDAILSAAQAPLAHDRYLRLHGCVGQRTARLQHCPRQRRRKEFRRRNR